LVYSTGDKSRLFSFGAMSSEEVGREGYQAMLKGKPLAVHGLKNKVLAGSVRFSPRAIVREIAAMMNRSPGNDRSAQLKS
jgi:short-subunit dehydrogenase